MTFFLNLNLIRGKQGGCFKEFHEKCLENMLKNLKRMLEIFWGKTKRLRKNLGKFLWETN